MDDVTVFDNGPYGVRRWQCLRQRRAGASSHKFSTYSSGGATVFDFVVLYNGSVSGEDMRCADIIVDGLQRAV